DPEALETIALASGGDARAALQLLELSVARLGGQEGAPRRLDREAVSAVLSAGGAVAHDKGGEAHFDTISALHKSIRGSDPDAALYWLARMLEGGEDPLYIARRLVRAASEDVGLADPQALVQANAAAQAVQLVGLPEGALALAQACVYLALAPKSDALYRGYGAAQREVRQRPAYPVPLALRNAPTALLRRLGYGQGYRNPHEEPEAVGRGPYLPEALEGSRYYVPTDRGLERRIGQRLASIAQARARLRGEAGHG
ncbi:MAG: replication-associated recombination protein A, partial [Planctomycetota bacterium]